MNKRFQKTKAADLIRDQEIHALIKSIHSEVHFTEPECAAILKLHANLTAETPLDRMQYRSVIYNAFKISNTFILDRMFHVSDLNDDGVIDGEEFLRCLSTMMRGSLEELTVFCFDVYNVNGDRYLAREELYMALSGSVRPGRGILDAEEVDESVKDIVEMAMRKLDVNHDGEITFDDFKAAVKADPLLLQVCGQCLPPAKYTQSIQYLLTVNYKNHTPAYRENWAVLEDIRHRGTKSVYKHPHPCSKVKSESNTAIRLKSGPIPLQGSRSPSQLKLKADMPSCHSVITFPMPLPNSANWTRSSNFEAIKTKSLYRRATESSVMLD